MQLKMYVSDSRLKITTEHMSLKRKNQGIHERVNEPFHDPLTRLLEACYCHTQMDLHGRSLELQHRIQKQQLFLQVSLKQRYISSQEVCNQIHTEMTRFQQCKILLQSQTLEGKSHSNQKFH